MNELEKAEIRLEMRNIYKDVGFTESLQVLLELIVSASIMAEVINEERQLEKDEEGLDTP